MARTRPSGNICGFATGIVLLAASAAMADPVTAPVLDFNAETLTTYKATNVTPVQGVRSRFDQRGVDIDGTLKSYAPLGWTVNADPFGGGYATGRTLGDVNLFTGSYHPTEVDLALPTLGLPIVIGRTFNSVQRDSGNALMNSDGYQGWNWAQMAQPEIRMYEDSGNHANDVVYLVYGADRYVEFARLDATATEYKSKNGAAGVVKYTAAAGDEPDTYTYFDQSGNQIAFFGFHANAGNAAGQLWKMTDRAGHVAYVGHETSGETAIDEGFVTGTGRVSAMFDASGRSYELSYDTYGSKTRLKKVEAIVSSTVVAKVEYDYYTETENDKGLAGDLRLVTITMPTDSGDYVRRKYYRYYTRAWADSAGRRGEPHAIKMVVGFEGTRKFDYDAPGDGLFDQDYYNETDANLKLYSDLHVEYAEGDSRIWKVTFNGNCGCGGGASGEHVLTYDDASGYSTGIAGTTYTTGYGKRTIIDQPDTTWVTQYFDETGAVLGRVVSAASPADWTRGSSTNKTWITNVVRDGNGRVETIRSPENVDTYTHSTGVITPLTNAGLVTEYTRVGSGNLAGLREYVKVRQGTTGTLTTMSSITLADRQLHIGTGPTTGVSLPVVTASVDAMGQSTLYSNDSSDYWSATESDVLYLARKQVTTTNPTVSTTNNGSGAATTSVRYVRKDGTTAITKDATGVLFYSGRSDFGQTTVQVADLGTSSLADIVAEDKPSSTLAWSVSSSGTPIHTKTAHVYDDQGRHKETAAPSVAGTRTSKAIYGVLGDGRLYTQSFPLVSGASYYGPVAYAEFNHAGKVTRKATVVATGSIPSTTPGSTTWSGMVDQVYDSSGMRLADTRTYTSTSLYDSAAYSYDSMGRREKVVDATATITRTVFDDRGMPIARWVGTSDTSFDPSSGGGDMTKVEAMEYDDNASGGGGNGLLTKRIQDPDGNWGVTTDQRVTNFTYDFRGRVCIVENPESPHRLTKYDNANRAIAVGEYNSISGLTISTDPTSTASVSSTKRLTLSESAFDARGQLWQTVRWAINPSDGAKVVVYPSTELRLYTDYWYDANGRNIKMVGEQITKTIYDRLGRVLGNFTLAQTLDEDYADAVAVNTGDTVLEERHSVLHDATGRALVQYSVQRMHDDPLGNGSGTGGTEGKLDPYGDAGILTVDPGSIEGRVQIQAMWYDTLDRVSNSVNVGTNGGTSFNRASSLATRSDTYLRTDYGYDDLGRQSVVHDPAGVVNEILFDFAGRKKTTWDDRDGLYRVTDFAYTDGLLTTVIRRLPYVSTPGDQDQTTTYVYGAEKNTLGSQISDNRLLLKTILPSYSGGSDTDHRTLYAYSALGEVIKTTDPAGNVISTTYDKLGRASVRTVDTYGSGFDERVKKIEYAYSNRGHLSGVKQKNSSNVVLDETVFGYNSLGRIEDMQQDPDSAYLSSGRAPFGSGWYYQAIGPTSHRRTTTLGSWILPYDPSHQQFLVYPESDIDTAIGRIGSVHDAVYNIYASYEYKGAGSVVGVRYPESEVYNILYNPAEEKASYDGHLDQFNRPIVNQWVKDLGGDPLNPTFVDFSVTYNRYGQPLAVEDKVLKDASGNRNFDALTSYDTMRRSTGREEGQLDDPPTAIDIFARTQALTRNLNGLVTRDLLDLNANSVYTDGPPNAVAAGEMDDTRGYDKRNQIVKRNVFDSDNPVSDRVVAPAYDKNGNLTDDGEQYKFVYNPFGQLVQIKNQSDDVLAVYTYSGLGHRISEQLDTNDSGNSGTPDGEVDGYDPVFYIATDLQGRRLATYRGSDDYPKEQLIYHPDGITGPGFAGGVAYRDRDGDLAGNPAAWATTAGPYSLSERRYHCSDFRGDVVALITGYTEYGSQLAEQYRYSMTGIPIGIPLGDVDGDGLAVYGSGYTGDGGIVMAISYGAYEVRGDLDLDGDVDYGDSIIIAYNDSVQTGRGKLSAPAVGSRVGFKNMEAFGEGFGVVWTPIDQDNLAAELSFGLSRMQSLQNSFVSTSEYWPSCTDGFGLFKNVQYNFDAGIRSTSTVLNKAGPQDPLPVFPPRPLCDAGPTRIAECNKWAESEVERLGVARHSTCWWQATTAGATCCQLSPNASDCRRRLLVAYRECTFPNLGWRGDCLSGCGADYAACAAFAGVAGGTCLGFCALGLIVPPAALGCTTFCLGIEAGLQATCLIRLAGCTAGCLVGP